RRPPTLRPSPTRRSSDLEQPGDVLRTRDVGSGDADLGSRVFERSDGRSRRLLRTPAAGQHEMARAALHCPAGEVDSEPAEAAGEDRKSTRLNSSHRTISY